MRSSTNIISVQESTLYLGRILGAQPDHRTRTKAHDCFPGSIDVSAPFVI